MKLDFSKNNGLIPAIIQNDLTNDVLMLGFMNPNSYELTLETGYVTFYSRSRKRIWKKGETSGNTLKVISTYVDCDYDTLLIRVIPSGPVCHTGSDNCFGYKSYHDISFISKLEQIIEDRKNNPQIDSYTSKLFDLGTNRIIQKFGEESVEVIIASKDKSNTNFLNESADMLYHFIVLLKEKNVELKDVIKILNIRHINQKNKNKYDQCEIASKE